MTNRLPIPAAALAQHIIGLGKTRSGKSSKLRVIVEHLLDQQKPVGIIDPKGDWWGLKSSADGKRSGYPIVIFGGEHADVPINAHAGAHVAELVATGNRPYLIDLGGWMVGERTRFFIDFSSTLFRLTRGLRHLVIDEVHNFCPKGKVFDVDAGKMLHWANRLASEGQGKGLVLIAASQRPQKVHNDFLTSCETLIASKVIHKADRDAIKDWIDGCADPAIGREVLADLAQLQRPEAWVWSPEAGFGPKKVAFPMFETYDSFKPQAPDQTRLKGWAEVDLDEVKTKLANVVAEAEANDPRLLRKQIVELQRNLSLVKGAKAGTSDDDLREAVAAADARGYERGLANAVTGFERMTAAFRDGLIEAVQQSDKYLFAAIDRIVQRPGPVMTATEGLQRQRPAPAIPKAVPPPRLAPLARATNGTGGVSQRILNALAELEQLGAREPARELVAFMAGYTNLRSKGFQNAIGSLHTSDLIRYGNGTMALTDTGRMQADASARPTSSGELQERVIRMLGGASGRILLPLIDAYPHPVPRDEVASRAGYENVRSKGFANAIGRLRSLGFIDYPTPGHLVAQPVLFLQ